MAIRQFCLCREGGARGDRRCARSAERQSRGTSKARLPPLFNACRFLKMTLEDDNSPRVDLVLGEDRAALFSKLSLLLSQIPLVK